MAVVLALLAALRFAGGTVRQQKVAQTASEDEALKAGFLLRLARRPQWLAGIALDAGGFVCQAIALGVGRLVVVQPILATSVVFALPLGNRLTGQHIGRREVVAALAVAAGLAVFLVVADPSGGRDDADATAWIVSFAVIGVASAALVGAGLRAGPGPKATLFGIATGILFGLSAALTKTCVERLDDGVLALLGDWELYALIVVGWVGMTLCQASLQTGRLAPAMATQMVLDPVTSVLLGTLAFDETIHTSAAGLVFSLVALVVMLAGLVVLASSASGAQEPSSPADSAANRALV
jgi:drug/metabolite transporter (DMT)-like permease